MNKTIWSFDLGKASIGEAVRDVVTNDFVHKASLLIPAEFASTKDAVTRRRMWRTRRAHKAREAWLDEVCQAAGLTPLQKREVWKNPTTKKWELKHPADERLEREFPKKGDSTCYTSCLLRIKLLRGEKLEPWQIYKALHSAIQKRGYGRVPWAAREAKRGGRTDEEMEKEMAKKDPGYRAAIEAWPGFKHEIPDSRFHFPCYYDAMKMGLWDPSKPDVTESRINCNAASTSKVRFDRADVEKEIAQLVRQAGAQLPPLAKAFERWKKDGWTVRDEANKRTRTFPVVAADIGDFFVNGPAGEPLGEAQNDFTAYLAFRANHGIHPGSIDDWMGATAQKTPRFDNRIVNQCALISRLQVCNVSVRFDKETDKPYPDSLLASEVTFLMKLKNTLVKDSATHRKLNIREIKAIFAVVSAEAQAVGLEEKNAEKKVTERFALTKSAWGKTKGIKELGLQPITNHEEVKSPKLEGRSRFSRPALRLMRAMILSAEKPSQFLRRLEKRDAALLEEIGMDVLDSEPARFTGAKGTEKKFVKHARPWVLVDDLKFITDLAATNDTWEDLHFPEQRLDALEARHTDEAGKVDIIKAVREVIGSINDPVVRHRLGVFSGRISEHHRNFGVPEEVVIEFVREDFMGEQAKRDLQKFNSEREKARKEAKERAAELGAGEKSGQLKYELLKMQGGKCLYCQQDFNATSLSEYRIEHIVPRKQGGPDAMVNFVLAHETCNDLKGEMTPFQWKHGKEGWDAYQTCVKLHATTLRNKKVQLLLREDAPELVQRYTALAETAWISRLAQKIVSLHFGWRNGIDYTGKKPEKRVTVISGGLTARIRRKYKLNSLLAKPPEGEIDLQEWESKAEKNRSDDRHHALDAMVINFLPQWTRQVRKEHFFRFPETVQKNPRGFFEKHIAAVMPHNIAYEKAALAETNYGSRRAKSGIVIVQRVALNDLAMKPIAPGKTKFDLSYLRKQIKGLRDMVIADALTDLLELEPDEERWLKFCRAFRLRHRDGSPGSRVLRVNVYVGEPFEYCELSKDGTGTWRRGLGSHKGQIIFWNENGVLSIRPVFAHGSIAKERRLIEKLGGKAKFFGFFQSDCSVRTTKEIAPDKYKLVVKNEAKQKRRIIAEKPLLPCELTLRTIITKDFIAELTQANNTRVVAALDIWVEAGLERV